MHELVEIFASLIGQSCTLFNMKYSYCILLQGRGFHRASEDHILNIFHKNINSMAFTQFNNIRIHDGAVFLPSSNRHRKIPLEYNHLHGNAMEIFLSGN